MFSAPQAGETTSCTQQILLHWQPFRDLQLKFVGSRRAEQLSLRSQERIVATVEESVLRIFGRSRVYSIGQLTHTRRSDGDPESDGGLREVVRKKILHDRQLYINRADPIAFMPVAVDTSVRIYDDFSRLLFLHAHREASALTNELPEESGQFRFLR